MPVPATGDAQGTTLNRREFKGNRMGATGLRASERKSASEKGSERGL